MNIADTQNADDLFELWRAERPNYTHFSNDGILRDEVWATQSPKIAFILKESNNGFHEIRGKSHVPSTGNSRLFWRNLNIWSYAVKQFVNANEGASFVEAMAMRNKPVGHVAYINLKKLVEGKTISSDREIQGYADRDWDFIDQQLHLINPDVVFCCGTYQYIATRLGHGAFSLKNKTVIDFFHPSCRKAYKTTFDALCRRLSTASGEINESSKTAEAIQDVVI